MSENEEGPAPRHADPIHSTLSNTTPQAQDNQPSLFDGVRLAGEHTDAWWRSQAQQALQVLARRGHVFEAYDLTELGVTDPDSPARWGPIFREAEQSGLIEVAGYGPSKRPTRRGGACRYWRGAK